MNMSFFQLQDILLVKSIENKNKIIDKLKNLVADYPIEILIETIRKVKKEANFSLIDEFSCFKTSSIYIASTFAKIFFYNFFYFEFYYQFSIFKSNILMIHLPIMRTILKFYLIK